MYLLVGKKTEEYIVGYLNAKGHTIINHSEEPEWQMIDTDFEVIRGNSHTTLEVKTDNRIHNTNNFFFEVGFDRATGYYDGWFHNCAAEYICFVDMIGARGYILEFDKTRIAQCAFPRRWRNSIDGCYGDAYLLNCDKARAMGLIVYEWNI